ncbi:MAG TPA: hypothetical protein VMS96_10545 [Terriglobales bacterium]|nr:hypothetical protein [Terriglobales bacterium]
MKRALLIAFVLASAVLLSVQAAPQAASTEKKAAEPAASTRKVRPGKLKMFSSSSIQVLEFRSVNVKVPAQFEMAMYENTIDEVEKLGKFKNVYRDGDKRADADPDVVKLRISIVNFKEGSARKRQVTTVAGATSVRVSLRLEDPKGPALEKEVEGAVNLMGENLTVTRDLAKNIAVVVDEHF